MPVGTWIVETCASERFPYRIQIFRGDNLWLVLRAQDRWPSANRNIFCLRESASAEAGEVVEEIERAPIIALQQRGVRLSVVIDRPRNKRCDFLFLTKRYKTRPAEAYEQIYFQTQGAMVQRRPKVRPASLARAHGLVIQIASDERYPWRFPGSEVSRGRLAAGDYALMDEGRIAAVVERKTFENLLADLGVMPILHQRLLELSTYDHSAVVVEAPYEDFLNPKKVHYYSPRFCAAAIAELYAFHPRLRIVFCANRKTANAWTQSYFAAVSAVRKDALADSPLKRPPD